MVKIKLLDNQYNVQAWDQQELKTLLFTIYLYASSILPNGWNRA